MNQRVSMHIKWEPVTGAWAAYEDVFKTWFGLGPTPQAAIDDLSSVLQEALHDLEAESERLSPAMHQQLEQLRLIA